MRTLTALLFAAMMLPLSASAAEALLGYTYTTTGVTIQVNSGGCTSKEDFKVETIIGPNYYDVTFNRTQPDFCEAFFVTGVTIDFTWAEMGLRDGDQFQITNPMQVLRVVNF